MSRSCWLRTGKQTLAAPLIDDGEHAERPSIAKRIMDESPYSSAQWDRPGPAPGCSAADVAEGQRVFRFETFGDEQLWTDTLRLHEVVEKSVDPTTALKVGLKVDADVLPAGISRKSISRVRPRRSLCSR
jgi:hypothetical protein